MSHIRRIDEFNYTETNLSGKDVLNTAHKKYDEYLDGFDIQSIPASIKNTSINFKWISDFASDVSESALIGIQKNKNTNDDIESIQKVVENLQNKYKISGMLFTAYDPFGVQIVKVEQIPNYLQTTNSILLPYVTESVKTIKKEMLDNGYYCVNEREYYDKDTKHDWVMLIFDPIRQDSISSQIKSHCDILYHCSPTKNKKSILENGFVPKNEGRVYHYYENRVYFHTDSPKSSEFKRMMSNLTKNRKKNNISFDGKYDLYYIDMNSINDDIDFFKDPHGHNSIFTKEKISSDSIIKISEITF